MKKRPLPRILGVNAQWNKMRRMVDKLPSNSLILDLGAGSNAESTRKLARFRKDVKVIGIADDLSQKKIKGTNFKCIKGDIREMKNFVKEKNLGKLQLINATGVLGLIVGEKRIELLDRISKYALKNLPVNGKLVFNNAPEKIKIGNMEVPTEEYFKQAGFEVKKLSFREKGMDNPDNSSYICKKVADGKTIMKPLDITWHPEPHKGKVEWSQAPRVVEKKQNRISKFLKYIMGIKK